MPIYQGISTKNKAEIIINNQQMQKVYVGDRLVWQKPSGVYLPKYGLLYNWYAATDVRNIANTGWHVPSTAEYNTLISYLGGSTNAAGKLKETGTIYWNTPNTGATNETGFNARGTGVRGYLGEFSANRLYINIWSITLNSGFPEFLWLKYNSAESSITNTYRVQGHTVRFIKNSTTLSNGETGTYIGNDGKVYRTICIGTQEWLADNLCETRFRSGDIIPWYGANPVDYFTNAEWAALTTAGMCAYNNDVNNVAAGFTFPT